LGFTGRLSSETLPQYLVAFSLDTTGRSRHNPGHHVGLRSHFCAGCFRAFFAGCLIIKGSSEFFGRDHATVALQMNLGFAASGGEKMQFLPGFTVQCINPLCEARGHWLRADATTPLGSEGRCPCCGDFLRNVPPPLSPRFRMRPRSLTARPPLRPRPR